MYFSDGQDGSCRGCFAIGNLRCRREGAESYRRHNAAQDCDGLQGAGIGEDGRSVRKVNNYQTMIYPSVGQYTEAIKLAEQCDSIPNFLQILPHHIHQSANKIEWQVYKP